MVEAESVQAGQAQEPRGKPLGSFFEHARVVEQEDTSRGLRIPGAGKHGGSTPPASTIRNAEMLGIGRQRWLKPSGPSGRESSNLSFGTNGH